MKILLSILLSVSVLCVSTSAIEYGNITQVFGEEEAVIVLQVGDVAEILNITGRVPNNQGAIWNFSKRHSDGNEFLIGSYRIYDDGIIPQISSQLIQTEFVGPCVLFTNTEYIYTEEYAISIDYKITRASEVEYKNVNIVALPSSSVGAGTHEIVVEASDDLQSWTPVHSSSIGGNKAFFRTRVVRTGE